MSETVELTLPPLPLQYPVELVGRIVRGISRTLHYELSAPLRVPGLLLVRPSPESGSPWRFGIGRVGADGGLDLSAIPAVCEGDYLYRVGEPLSPSLEDRVAALETLLGIAADDLEVASDADAIGNHEAAAAARLQALLRIRSRRSP